MKYFTVTADFDLIKKPEWLDDFRRKYDEPFQYHVTLKTATKILEKDINVLRHDLQKIIKNFKKTKINFDKLYINKKAVNGACIMILAEENIELLDLQKKISKKLSKFGEHYFSHHKEYEDNFLPHITIGRGLEKTEFEKAEKDLQNNIKCSAIIDQITLIVADKVKPKEMMDPKNKEVFNLN